MRLLASSSSSAMDVAKVNTRFIRCESRTLIHIDPFTFPMFFWKTEISFSFQFENWLNRDESTVGFREFHLISMVWWEQATRFHFFAGSAVNHPMDIAWHVHKLNSFHFWSWVNFFFGETSTEREKGEEEEEREKQVDDTLIILIIAMKKFFKIISTLHMEPQFRRQGFLESSFKSGFAFLIYI